jgi:hypothetical protein
MIWNVKRGGNMAGKKTSTKNIEEALKHLSGAAESVKLAVKDYGPQVLDALKKNTMKAVGAPSPESGAELIMRQVDKYVRDVIYLAEECHIHLGYRGEFSEWFDKK